MRFLGLIALLIGSTGCATQTVLTVYSQPAGAYVSEIGTSAAFGIAPTTVVYSSNQLKQNGRDPTGCYVLRGLQAKWVSGATASIEPVQVCGSSTGNYHITLVRDQSSPDLEKDLHFALQVEATRAQQQQAQTASDAALIAAYTAIQQSRPTQCTSTAAGESVQTVCN